MATTWLAPRAVLTGARMFRGALKAGQIAYDEGRYVDALKLWRKAAERDDGDGEAEFRIGRSTATARACS